MTRSRNRPNEAADSDDQIEYSFVFNTLHRFLRDYSKLSEIDQTKVEKALKQFKENPWHPGLNTEKIDPKKKIWSIRASKNVRITFNWDGNQITLRVVGGHEVYRNP